jgi:hypothetical protein
MRWLIVLVRCAPIGKAAVEVGLQEANAIRVIGMTLIQEPEQVSRGLVRQPAFTKSRS